MLTTICSHIVEGGREGTRRKKSGNESAKHRGEGGEGEEEEELLKKLFSSSASSSTAAPTLIFHYLPKLTFWAPKIGDGVSGGGGERKR